VLAVKPPTQTGLLIQYRRSKKWILW